VSMSYEPWEPRDTPTGLVPAPPEHEPEFRSPVQEHRGPLRRIGGGVVGGGLLALKFVGQLAILFKFKFLFTFAITVGAYALFWGWWFGLGFAVLLLVHELGHVLWLRREGISSSLPVFVPFMGAFVAMKEMPKNALVEARVGLAGPIFGTLGGLGALGLYAATENPLFLGLAYFNFFINLLNLAPMLPLDGGRAVGAMSPMFWLLGIVLIVALLFVTPLNPILLLVAFLGGTELWRRWKMRNTPEGQAYYKIELRHRVMVGLVYVGLIVVLALLMAATFVPDPAGQFAAA
jgi:Zn-dependent protease